MTRRIALLFSLLCPPFGYALAAAPAQVDFYDEDVLRTIEIVFPDGNWHSELLAKYDTGQYVKADLRVDGVTYSSVGVQHKGDSGYTGYPGSPNLKESLKITLDAFVQGQDIQGFDKLSLDNGRQSSVFNEVVFLWLAADYLPAPRANLIHVLAGPEGDLQDLGVYTNTERVDKAFFERVFGDDDGHRYERNEDNLLLPLPFEYQGSEADDYVSDYSAQGGDPATLYHDVRDVAEILAFAPAGQVHSILEAKLDIDALIRTLALESMTRNVDGLWRGNNYFLYEDRSHGGRLVPLPWDADQALLNTLTSNPPDLFCGPGDAAECPLSRLLEEQPWDRRLETYHQHFLDGIFHWDVIGPRLLALRDLAAPKILASPHDLITNQAQLDFAIGRIESHIANKRSFLNTTYVMDYERPTISNLVHSPANPAQQDTIRVSASVAGPASGLGEVLLHSRVSGPFVVTPMSDDGQAGDVQAGDGIYTGVVPQDQVQAAAGAAVDYYVEARAANIAPGFDGVEIHPFAGEFSAARAPVSLGDPSFDVRITEVLYKGSSGEFIELTNLGTSVVDFDGWTLRDGSAIGDGFDLSLAPPLLPGQSLLVVDVLPGSFRAAWQVPGEVPILGPNHVANFGRNDEVRLFSPGGALEDHLAYGDETFPGTARPKDFSIFACVDVLGLNQVYSWEQAFAGDPQGSFASSQGDLGSPGTFALAGCALAPVCAPASVNSAGASAELVAYGDLSASGPPQTGLTLRAAHLPGGQFAYPLASPVEAFLPGAGGSQGNLCLGGPIGRGIDQLQSTGSTGVLEFQVDAAALSGPDGPVPASPGERWLFQVWYRDLNPDPTSNFSSALAVTWR